MTRRISLGLLVCGVACSGHPNELGIIHASGGSTANVNTAAGGFTQPASSGMGGAATGGFSPTGSTVTGGSTAAGGNATTGGVAAGGTAAGGESATGGTSGAFVLDLRCTADTDCCVISNSCGTGFYLVTAAQKNELAARIGNYPTTMCPACIPPQVTVSCVQGSCVGVQLNTYDPTSALSKGHCGPVGDAGAAGGSAPKSTTGTGASSAPGPAGGASPPPAPPTGGTTASGGTTSAPITRFGCG